MADLEDVVQGHTVQMAMMSGKLDTITDGMNDMKIILREISTTQQNMAILMERVENHEENTKLEREAVKESFKAVHSRITRIEENNTATNKLYQDRCDLVMPMAKKADDLHKGMVFVAKSLGGSVLLMLFGLVLWAIKTSDYK